MSVSSSSYLLLLLVTAAGFFFFHGNSATYWEDVEVLKQLRGGLDPSSVSPGSCLSSWDFTLDPCDSLFGEKFTCGFRCDVVDSSTASRVTELTLDQAGYSGSLASTSWNLPYLQTLDLSNNKFAGPIPDSLSNLTGLQRLVLSGNSLSDSVPSSLGSLASLEEIYLDNNNLHGTIPSSLNGLNNLKRLELQHNQLGGQFPDLSQLSNLNFLDASDNAISGELPANFPASLMELSARNNQIEGNIPASLLNSAYLQVMDLSHNRLSGPVPSGLFTHPSLQQLTLSDNQFELIQLPANWGKILQSQLIAVDMSNNEIRGLLPDFMGWMPQLSALSLENNKLSGMIPVQYAMKTAGPGEGVSGFERLLLGGNYLFGAIPGPLLGMKPGSATVSLGDNCLYRCPARFFFCQGGEQKSLTECKIFGPVIP
ncbi:hypothetical protein RJ639_018438 [Escallonia herrerae]|uniref:Disease resistance R13L4/SHOC-2-like LRR domain-containing protein n=1 Tax=Escallonia herrerae TaxID=1293975 RepID=A0AA88VAB0_9ASTE|nr:hypothetical protein RJ639_018438 [Escallonia herrerae]